VNAALAGPVPEVGVHTGRHTGFPVAHRLARKHGLEVRLACRPAGPGGSGTIAMVTIPASLVCEIPDQADPAPPRNGAPATRGASRHRSEGQPSLAAPEAAEAVPDRPRPSVTRNGLPRREPGSARNAVRGGRPLPDRIGLPDPARAGQSFAVDIAAFTAGNPDSGRPAPSGAGGEHQDVAEGQMY
jgi:hypothetical protein